MTGDGSASTGVPVPPPRLHLLVAREAPCILIIRRGPSRVFHLIAWNTETDEMEPGSWFRGRLYVHRCDLSFDGRWFVYFAFGPTRELYSWVAISQPPWLRAEVLWPKEDCWRGGGVFTGRNRLWLNLAPDARPRAGDKSPKELGLRLEQSLAEAGEDEGPFFRRLERDGWQRAGDWSEGREVATPKVLKPFGTWRAKSGREGSDEARAAPAGWLYYGDPGWFLQPSGQHPTLRMYYRGYYLKRGRVYEYALDGSPGLLDAAVEWAGWAMPGGSLSPGVELSSGTPSRTWIGALPRFGMI